MEKFKELVTSANKHLRNADHILYMTYPLVKDIKLLINVLGNIDKAIKTSVLAFLYYDWVYKRIISIPEDFESRLDLFRKISTKRYEFTLSDIDLIKEISEIIEKHKKSPVEFVKNNKFVICYNHYKIKTIEYEDVKKYYLKAKPFMDTVERGIFSIRAPSRPNPIGISTVKLNKIEGNVLYIENVDIVDGTPLIDIKPYVPKFDVFDADKIGWLEKNIDKLSSSKDDGRFI